MKRTTVAALLTLALVTPANAMNAGEGCSVIGSWFGYDAVPTNATWMATFSGQSSHSGVMVLEPWAVDLTLGGYFPTIVKSTLWRGSWTRTNGHTFAVTMLGFGLDAEGRVVTIARLRSTDSLSEDCNVMTVRAVLDVFLADQNPLTDTPVVGPITMSAHDGYRIAVLPVP